MQEEERPQAPHCCGLAEDESSTQRNSAHSRRAPSRHHARSPSPKKDTVTVSPKIEPTELVYAELNECGASIRKLDHVPVEDPYCKLPPVWAPLNPTYWGSGGSARARACVRLCFVRPLDVVQRALQPT